MRPRKKKPKVENPQTGTPVKGWGKPDFFRDLKKAARDVEDGKPKK